MTMQNKLYTIQFFSPPVKQFSQSLSSNHRAHKSQVLLSSWKSSNTPWTRWDSNSQEQEEQRAFLPPANCHS